MKTSLALALMLISNLSFAIAGADKLQNVKCIEKVTRPVCGERYYEGDPIDRLMNGKLFGFRICEVSIKFKTEDDVQETVDIFYSKKSELNQLLDLHDKCEN